MKISLVIPTRNEAKSLERTIKEIPAGFVDEIIVSDEEHKQAMTHLRRDRARIDKIETGLAPQKAAEEAREMKEEELPPLDDKFVQSLGMENAEKFSETVRANIKTEKEMQAGEKNRAALLEKLVSSSQISYPKMLRDYELDDMESRLKHDIEQAGMTWTGYISETKKTREELRESWKETADKRTKVRLILTEIARKENIKHDETRFEEELMRAKKQIPNADPAALQAHIAHTLQNESVINWLLQQWAELLLSAPMQIFVDDLYVDDPMTGLIYSVDLFLHSCTSDVYSIYYGLPKHNNDRSW